MSFRFLLLSLLIVMSGCASLPKPHAAPALYDFGIAATNPQPVEVRSVHVEAIPGLDGHEMRYRLAYQNPAQVFAYNESGWVSPPADLVEQRINNQWNFVADATCSVHVTLEVFDQVFDSATTSRGLVQLRAELVNGSGRHALLASTVVKSEKSSPSADARGGVTALTAATDEAVTNLATWVSVQKCAPIAGEN